MQTRQNANCWKLFSNSISSMNGSLLKLLTLTLVLLDYKASGAEVSGAKFFNRNIDFASRNLKDPCVQAFPGAHLLVNHGKEGGYDVSQYSQFDKFNDFHTASLENQIRRSAFVGDFFCNGKLETLKENQLPFFKDKNYANSVYTVDLREPDFFHIEVSTNNRSV